MSTSRDSEAFSARTAATAVAVRPFVMSRVIVATAGSLLLRATNHMHRPAATLVAIILLSLFS